ncbi:hypothetical protein DL96DRAFT_1305585 [Flagelloscypha sp. PMI_526]|nr:hypothetical protein DL96DRAFT_1305585 [Flagelloscypha sp. PMI_526]
MTGCWEDRRKQMFLCGGCGKGGVKLAQAPTHVPSVLLLILAAMSSSTNGMVAGPSTSQSPSGTPVSWEGDRMFNIYIYDYCSKRGFKQTAQQLLQEAELPHDAAPPINARQGLLFEWWSVFWVLFSAKAQNNPHVNNNTGADPHVVGAGSGGHPTPRNEDAALYIDHHQRQQQMRHMRNLPPGAAPGVGGPPPPPPGHPNSAALANPALAQPIPPGRLNGIPGGPPPPGMGGPGMRRAPPFAPARPPSRAGQIMPQGYPGMPHPSHAGPPPGMYQHPPHLTLANLEIEFSKLPAQFVQITKSELGIPPERDLGPEEKPSFAYLYIKATLPTATTPSKCTNSDSERAHSRSQRGLSCRSASTNADHR